MEGERASRREFLYDCLAGGLIVAGLALPDEEAGGQVMTTPISFYPCPEPNSDPNAEMPDVAVTQAEGGTKLCARFTVPTQFASSRAPVRPAMRLASVGQAGQAGPSPARRTLVFDVHYETQLPLRPYSLTRDPGFEFPPTPEQLLHRFPEHLRFMEYARVVRYHDTDVTAVQFEIRTNRTLYPVQLSVTVTASSGPDQYIARGTILIVRAL